MTTSCNKDEDNSPPSGDGTGGGGGNGGGGGGNGGGGGIEVPGQVYGLSSTLQSNTSIRLTWTSVTNATSYEILYEKGVARAGSSPSSSAVMAGTTTTSSYTHTGLGASTFYTYWVRAVNSAGKGNFSFGNAAGEKTPWGGGNLTVTGYSGYTSTTGLIRVMTTNPMTWAEAQSATTIKTSFINNNSSICDWSNGHDAPPDGTYTIVVCLGGYNPTGAYKFTNISVIGGRATVPFNMVAGSVVGTNGRLL
jgi:hypothetical protein